MNDLIYEALSVIFDSTLASDVKDFLVQIMDGLVKVFSDTQVQEYFTIFSAAAGSLLIIFFFINLADNATKDMITFERLILSMIKLFVGLVLLIFLPEIIQYLFALIRAVYEMAAGLEISQSNLGITFWGEKKFPEFDEEKMQFITGGIASAILGNLGTMLICLISFAGSMAARFAAYFFAISNALMLITRAVFSPLAVAQCFDDGQRSNAVRYLKKFAADGLTLAVILGLLFASSILQANITAALLQDSGIHNIDETTALQLLDNIGLVVTILVINFSCIGAIMKANQLAHDIVGAN